MYSGSLQSRIAEKNLKENNHTKIEQNQKAKNNNKTKPVGLVQKFFVFCFTMCFLLVLGPIPIFSMEKDGFSTKNPKIEKDGFSIKNQKTHGKSWFFNQKPKTWKKLVWDKTL